MTLKLLSVEAFKAAAKDGSRPEAMVFRLATGEPQIVDETRTARFVFSDDRVDLAGDSIKQDGWETDDFNANPVALFSHASWDPPIGRAANVGVKGNKLVGDIEFASADIYPFADTIYRLVKGGFLKAVSVGFMPLECDYSNDKDRPYGMVFLRQKLLEISLCSVPCNPGALIEARAAGIDTEPLREWASKVLDSGDQIMVPRQLLEETFKAAKTPKTTRQKYLKPTKTAEEIAAETAAAEAARAASEAADSAIIAPGNCGRTQDETCGMTNPQECSVHYVAPEQPKTITVIEIKAGRRISAANRGKLEAAMTHHDEASKCIKSVLDSNDPTEPDPDAEDPIDPTELAAPTAGQDDPEQQRAKRIAEAQAIVDRIKP